MSVFYEFRKRIAELKAAGLPALELPDNKTVLLMQDYLMNKSCMIMMSYIDSVYVVLIYNDIKVKAGAEFLEGTTQRSLTKSYRKILSNYGVTGDCDIQSDHMSFRIDVTDPSVGVVAYVKALVEIIQDMDVVIGAVYE